MAHIIASVQTALVLLLGVLALALFAGTLIAASVAGAALRRGIRYALIARHPNKPIAELGSGPGRAHGYLSLPGAAPGRPLLTSPISGRACVYFELSGTYMGRPCFLQREGIECALTDGTSELPIDPLATELVLTNEAAWKQFSVERAPAGMEEGLKARLLSTLADIASREKRELPPALDLTERALYLGEPLHVSGTLLRVGPSISLVGGRPVIASDRPFRELALREGLLGAIGLSVALLVVGVLVNVGAAIIERSVGR